MVSGATTVVAGASSSGYSDGINAVLSAGSNNENSLDSDACSSVTSSIGRSKSNSSISSSSSGSSSSSEDSGSSEIDRDTGVNIKKPSTMQLECKGEAYSRYLSNKKDDSVVKQLTHGKEVLSTTIPQKTTLTSPQDFIGKIFSEKKFDKSAAIEKQKEENRSKVLEEQWARKRKWVPIEKPKQLEAQALGDSNKVGKGITRNAPERSSSDKQRKIQELMDQWAERKRIWNARMKNKKQGQKSGPEPKAASKPFSSLTTNHAGNKAVGQGRNTCSTISSLLKAKMKEVEDALVTSPVRKELGNETKRSAFSEGQYIGQTRAVAPAPIGSAMGSTMTDDNNKEKMLKQSSQQSKRAPLEKPKQPLTAYNLFFQHERKLMLGPEFVKKMEMEAKNNGEEDKKRRPHRKTHGKIGFVEMSRAISSKWKQLDEPTRRTFQDKAKALKVNHEKEMAAWRIETQRQQQDPMLQQEQPQRLQFHQVKAQHGVDFVEQKQACEKQVELRHGSMKIDNQGRELNGNQEVQQPDLPLPILMEKPKRPLTAYNLYFQHERRAILGPEVIQSMELEAESKDPSQRGKRRVHRKTHGKLDFVEMVRAISAKWKQLDKSTRDKFDAMAEEEKLRYKKEMEIWTRQSEEATQRQKQQQRQSEDQHQYQQQLLQYQQGNVQSQQQELLRHAQNEELRQQHAVPSQVQDENRALQPQSEQHFLHPQGATLSYRDIPASTVALSSTPADPSVLAAVPASAKVAEAVEDEPLTSEANKSAAAAAAAAAAYETFKSSSDRAAAAAAGAAAYKKIHSDAPPGVAAAAGAAAASAVISDNAKAKSAQENERSKFQMLNVEPWMTVGLMNQDRLFLNPSAQSVSSFIRNKNAPPPHSAPTARLNELEHQDLYSLYMASKIGAVTSSFGSSQFASLPPASHPTLDSTAYASALASRRQLDAALVASLESNQKRQHDSQSTRQTQHFTSNSAQFLWKK